MLSNNLLYYLFDLQNTTANTNIKITPISIRVGRKGGIKS